MKARCVGVAAFRFFFGRTKIPSLFNEQEEGVKNLLEISAGRLFCKIKNSINGIIWNREICAFRKNKKSHLDVTSVLIGTQTGQDIEMIKDIDEKYCMNSK